MAKPTRHQRGSEIYLGHEICPAGDGVVVQPYEAPFDTVEEARRWIDDHVAQERTRVQAGIRSPLKANPAMVQSLQHIARAQVERHARIARCGGKTDCGCAPARCGCSKPKMNLARNRASAFVNPLLGWRGGPSRNATGSDAISAGMSVNGAQMWALSATLLYSSADRIVCAAREMLQNARDAPPGVNKRKREGTRREVRITLARQSDKTVGGWPRWTLTCQDNGDGMSCVHHPPDAKHLERWVSGTLPDKFLDLGSSGKGLGADAEGERPSIGGFGVAKAIILGVSSSWRFEILTQDNIVTAQNLQAVYGKLPEPVVGTTIRVFDIEQSDEDRRLYGDTPEDRVRRTLTWSSLDEVDVWFNGERIKPQFRRAEGRRTKPFNANLEGAWGPGIESATVTSYKRDASLGDGNFYIQMDGLYQFNRPLEAPYDIVVDIIPAVPARDERYPMPMSRDGLKRGSDADRVLRQIAQSFIKDSLSVVREPDFVTTLPSGADSDATLTRLAGFFGADLGTMSGIIAGMHEVAQGALRNDDALSEIKSDLADMYQGEGANPIQQELGNPLGKIQKVIREDIHEIADDESREESSEDSAAPERGSVTFEGNGAEAVGAGIQALLDAAGLDNGTMNWRTRDSFDELQRGRVPNPEQLEDLVEFVGTLPLIIVKAGASGQAGAVVSQVEAAVATSTVLQGLVQLAQADTWSAPSWQVDRIKRAVAKVDPFRDLCAMKVHREFPKKLLRQFKRSPKKYLKILAAWDATLRLLSATLQIFPAFRIGFIFENDVRGAQQYESEDGWEYLYINPMYAANAVKARKRDPRALAYYFYGLACHELAHIRWGFHDERFVSAREDIGFAAAHVLKPLETLLRRVFNIGQQRAPRVAASGASDIDFSKLQAELASWKKSTLAWKASAETAQAEVDGARKLSDYYEKRSLELSDESQKEREARQTFERLWKESTTGMEAVAGNLWAMTGLRGYEDWITGPGAAFLPSGVDPTRFVEALRKHPSGAVKYLLGEGAMAAREVALAQAGVPVKRDGRVIEGMAAAAQIPDEDSDDEDGPAVDPIVWPEQGRGVQQEFDELPEHVQTMIDTALSEAGSYADPANYSWQLSRNDIWLQDVVDSSAYLSTFRRDRLWAPIILLTAGAQRLPTNVLSGWSTIEALSKIPYKQRPPVFVIRGWAYDRRDEGDSDDSTAAGSGQETKTAVSKTGAPELKWRLDRSMPGEPYVADLNDGLSIVVQEYANMSGKIRWSVYRNGEATGVQSGQWFTKYDTATRNAERYAAQEGYVARRIDDTPSASRRGPSVTETKLLERARASHNGQVHVTTGLDRGATGLARGRHYGDRELTALRTLIERGELVHVKDMEDRVAHGSQHTWVARLPMATEHEPARNRQAPQRWYHLTDNAKFELDPDYAPQDNAVAIEDRSGRAGIYLAPDVEVWVNGHNYWRPFVAEIEVDPSVKSDPGVHGRWGNEMFVPASAFDKLRVLRVIPLDAHAREVFEDYGWVEEWEGQTFDTGELLPPMAPRRLPGYHYNGPDVRDMSPKEAREHKLRLRTFLKGRQP